VAVFAYVIETVDRNYELTGCVPWVSEGLVLFGPCKKQMRPEVRHGDYILGISPSHARSPRRVLLWMRVAEKMTFAEAYRRGNTDKAFRAARGHAIHVRPKQGDDFRVGKPVFYAHISGAPHSHHWRSDIEGNRDAFLVSDPDSWVAKSDGPAVDEELVSLLKEGIAWKGNPTLENPLTPNARGKHAKLTGKTAQQVQDWISRRPPREYLQNSSRPTSCAEKCACP